MRKKIPLLAALAVICTVSLAALGNSSNVIDNILTSVRESSVVQKIFKTESKSPKKIESVSKQSENNISAQNVPDRIIYFIYFSHLVGLKKHAEEEQSLGNPSFDYLAMTQNEMSLSATQSAYLFQIAENCLNDVKPIDDQAQTIIRSVGDAFEDDPKTPPDTHNPPPPPLSLTALQKQKDDTVLQYRKELSSYLGDSSFAQIDQTVRGKIAPQVTLLGKRNAPPTEGETK